MKPMLKFISRRGPTLVLQAVIILLGVMVFSACVFTLMHINEAGYYLPVLFLLYLSAIPFFYALHQSFKLLHNLEKNKMLSEMSITALKKIKYCAVLITVLYIAFFPYVFYAADRDDAPGAAAMALFVIATSFLISLAALVLERSFQDASGTEIGK